MSMTIEEAIKRIRQHIAVHRIGEHPHIHIREALDMAIAALREKAEREDPQPLTIEQLLQMDQEPVYVVPLNHGKDTVAEWCVMWHDEAAIPGDECWAWPINNNYGKTWIAYRNKPKEVE